MFQKYKYIWYKLSTKSRGLQRVQLKVRSRVRKSSLECSGRWYVGELLDCWRVMDSMDWVRLWPQSQTCQNRLDGQQSQCLSWTLRNRGWVVKACNQGRWNGQKCKILNTAGVVQPKKWDLGGAPANHRSQSKCSDLYSMFLKSVGALLRERELLCSTHLVDTCLFSSLCSRSHSTH